MKDRVSIRQALRADADSIQLLLEDLGYTQNNSDSNSTFFSEILEKSDLKIFVAELESKVVGFYSYTVRPQLRLGALGMQVEEFVVRASARGFGVGTTMIDHLKKEAVENHVVRVILSTNRDRESYQRGFYQKNGFVEKNSAWMQLIEF